MSVRTISAVWEHSRQSGTGLLMLLALADFADDRGNAYPAVGTLARKCRMSPRNAIYILKGLQESGELEVRTNQGPRGTNRYRVVLEALKGVQPASGVQPVAGVQSSVATPAIQRRLPLQPIADEPSLNRQEPAKAEAFDAASAPVGLSAKERSWTLGVAVLGEKCRSLLGKLSAQYGDEVLAEVLAAAAAQMPLHDAKGWVVKACEVRKSARRGANDPFANPSPHWAVNAGFRTRFEAENEGCHQHNAHQFRDGHRITEAA